MSYGRVPRRHTGLDARIAQHLANRSLVPEWRRPRRRRRRATLTSLAVVVLALAACQRGESQTKRVERPAFAIDLPDWEVVVDDGRAGLGKYKVAAESGSPTAEISWQGGEPASPEDMRQMALALFGNTGIHGEIIAESELDDRYQVTADGVLNDTIWMRITMVTCRKTGVLLTMGTTDRDEAGAHRLHDEALASLECRGESPEGFEGTLEPASTLGPEFGFARIGEAMVLVDAEGRTVVIIGGPLDTVATARTQPLLVVQMIGNVFGYDLGLAGEPAEHETPGGASLLLVPAQDTQLGLPVTLAALPCERSGQGYVLMAHDEAGQSTQAELADLLLEMDCPDSGSPIYSERKSACAVGAQDYCG